MRVWKRSVLFLLCLSLSLHAEQAFQNWLTLSFSKRLDYSLEFMLESENKFIDDNPTGREFNLSPLLIWHYSPRYDFELGYMWTAMNMEDGSSSMHQAIAGVTIKIPIKDFLVTSRQRIEYGVQEQEDETVGTFRQLTRAEYANEFFFNKKLKPFIADEWFYNIEESFLSENRLYGGLSYEISSNFSTELYGMKQDIWMADGTNINGPIVGLNMKTMF